MLRSPRPSGPDAASARRRALAAATFLTSAALAGAAPPAGAAQLPVVPATVADPLLNNLAIPDNATTQGMWSGVRSWPLNAIHMTLLPTGKR